MIREALWLRDEAWLSRKKTRWLHNYPNVGSLTIADHPHHGCSFHVPPRRNHFAKAFCPHAKYRSAHKQHSWGSMLHLFVDFRHNPFYHRSLLDCHVVIFDDGIPSRLPTLSVCGTQFHPYMFGP